MDGRIDIELNGKTIGLFFSVEAARKYTTDLFMELAKTGEKNPKKAILLLGNFKPFMLIVQAGLAGYADLKELPTPSREEAYLIANEIATQGEELQQRIVTCFENSRATKEQIRIMQSNVKKKEQEASNRAAEKTSPTPTKKNNSPTENSISTPGSSNDIPKDSISIAV